MRSGKVVFGTCLVQIFEIDENSNGALFFVDTDDVRYLFRQGYGINKPCFEKFLYFSFDSYSFPWMDLSQFFPDRFGSGIGFYFVNHNGWLYP